MSPPTTTPRPGGDARFGMMILDVERRAVEDSARRLKGQACRRACGERLTGRLRAARRRGGALSIHDQHDSGNARRFTCGRRSRRDDVLRVALAFEARRFPRFVHRPRVLPELDMRGPRSGEDAAVVAGHVVIQTIADEREALLDAQIGAVEVAARVIPAVLVDSYGLRR